MNLTDWVFIALAILGMGGCLFQAGSRVRAKALQAKAEKELAAATAYSGALKEQLQQLHAEKEALGDELADYRHNATRLEAQKEALEQRIREQQEQMKLEFKNTASAIFDTMSNKFTQQSEQQIGNLLNPLKGRLEEFQKLVTESFTAQGKEQHTLKAEIEKIVLQADGLTKALRSDTKFQGNWGEIMLERILEDSGLQKGIGYVIQGTEMGLTGTDGNRLQPDVIVNLPDSKHIIIDSKVSLNAYEGYCSATDAQRQSECLRDFLKSVKAHINGLESKAYQDISKLSTPDFVLMFMPIEGAYALAVQQDPKLHGYAWEKRIVIVCPSTLFATLRTIASLWRIETQNRNAQEIARRGGMLYDKFYGFVEDLLSIGKQLTSTQKHYENAMSKLSSGSGNLIGQAEKLRQLGAKAAKPLPRELVSHEDAEETVLPLVQEN